MRAAAAVIGLSLAIVCAGCGFSSTLKPSSDAGSPEAGDADVADGTPGDGVCTSFSQRLDTCVLALSGDVVVSGTAIFPDTDLHELRVAGQPVERLRARRFTRRRARAMPATMSRRSSRTTSQIQARRDPARGRKPAGRDLAVRHPRERHGHARGRRGDRCQRRRRGRAARARADNTNESRPAARPRPRRRAARRGGVRRGDARPAHQPRRHRRAGRRHDRAALQRPRRRPRRVRRARVDHRLRDHRGGGGQHGGDRRRSTGSTPGCARSATSTARCSWSTR